MGQAVPVCTTLASLSPADPHISHRAEVAPHPRQMRPTLRRAE
jgi:hypothetical protein